MRFLSVLVAMAVATSPGKPAGGPSLTECGRVVAPALVKGLAARIRSSTSADALAQALTAVGMSTPWHKEEACKGAQPPHLKADVFRAALVGAKREDLVIQARGDACGEVVLEGVVLHPVAKGYCSVPLPFLPGVKEQPEQQVTFAFENLTDPSRQVFRVTEVTQQYRGEDYSLSYWEVQGGKLVQLFGIQGMSGVSGAVTSYSSNYEVTPEKNGSFPRRLVVEESVARCGGMEEMPSGEQVQKEGCEKTESRSIWCYRNGQYARCE